MAAFAVFGTLSMMRISRELPTNAQFSGLIHELRGTMFFAKTALQECACVRSRIEEFYTRSVAVTPERVRSAARTAFVCDPSVFALCFSPALA